MLGRLGYPQDGTANADKLLFSRAKVLPILSNILIEAQRVLCEEIMQLSIRQQINNSLISYGSFWVKVETKGSSEHSRVLKCKKKRLLLEVSQ